MTNQRAGTEWIDALQSATRDVAASDREGRLGCVHEALCLIWALNNHAGPSNDVRAALDWSYLAEGVAAIADDLGQLGLGPAELMPPDPVPAGPVPENAAVWTALQKLLVSVHQALRAQAADALETAESRTALRTALTARAASRLVQIGVP